MYGQIHLCVRELVLDKFGEDPWSQIMIKSGFDERTDFMVFHKYTDEKTYKLIGAVSEVAGAPLATVLEIFGDYFLTYCMNHGYDKMLRTLGSDFPSFIQNLDSLHALLAMSYKQLAAPSFRCETISEGRLTLHYYTVRPGLYPIVLGLVKAVARDLYKQNASIEVQKITKQQIEGGQLQEHVVFNVTLDDATRKKSTVSNEKQVAVKTKSDSDVLHISAKQFCDAIPYHLIFDKRLRVKQCGRMIQQLLMKRIETGTEMSKLFEIIQPRMTFTLANIQTFINAVFLIAFKGGGRRMILKGQMIWLDNIEQMIFLCSPRLTSLTELMEMNVFLSDIPLYDVTRELVLLNQQRIAEIDIAKKLDETTAELKKTSEALEEEKKKTDTLLYQMLPQKVAIDLKNGRSVKAEKFAAVTILFSDIVTFTNIAAACSPLEIVDMLNDLYHRFDKSTNQHNVYKVETIGDAYMIVSGVPETREDHAMEVANFSMDMIREASNIMSPVTGKPIQIRVGFHSGPVVSGVVGLKMPRYCLFGDTVNTASRMESHGVPGRIHVSPTAFKYITLDKGNYIIRERGEIDVKGKGKMRTYFLIGAKNQRIEEPDDDFVSLPLISNDVDVSEVITDTTVREKNGNGHENNNTFIAKQSTETSKHEQGAVSSTCCVL